MTPLKLRAARTAAALLIAGSGLGVANLLTSVAHADPAYENSAANMVGVGSDTIQDIFDAYTGANPFPPSSNAQFYAPLHSDANGGNAQVSSFDAIPAGGSTAAPGCITTKLGGPQFDRPDGSGNGRLALVKSLSASTPWVNPTASKSCTGSAVNVQGQVDFARSSSVSGTTGTLLTYVPFARDGVSYLYYENGFRDSTVGGVEALTNAQLTTLYSNSNATPGHITVNGHDVLACTIQSGSGTRSFFESKIGNVNTSGAAASSGCGENFEEHNGNAFMTWALANVPSGSAAVIPFSVTQWACQANNPCNDRSANARAVASPSHADVGYIDAPGNVGDAAPQPYSVDGSGKFQVSSTYFATTYGRDVYVVVPTTKLTGTVNQRSKALIGLFSGSGSAICNSANQATRALFGFAAPSLACGDITTQRGA